MTLKANEIKENNALRSGDTGYLIPNILGTDNLVCNFNNAYMIEEIILAVSTIPGEF